MSYVAFLAELSCVVGLCMFKWKIKVLCDAELLVKKTHAVLLYNKSTGLFKM